MLILRLESNHQVFNATSTTASSLLPSEELLSLVAPNQSLTTPLIQPDEAPLSNRKMRKMLGYEEKEEWNWRKELEKVGWDLGGMEKELREKLRGEGRLKN